MDYFKIRKIAASNRISFFFLERGYLELDGNAVVLRRKDEMIHVPVGAASCLMLAPGVTVTHRAVQACAEEQTLLIWIGEEGIRYYSAGKPGGAAATHILRQAERRLNAEKRMESVRRLYRFMFDEEPPQHRSLEQLRGIEGRRVKQAYKDFSDTYKVKWDGRVYDRDDFNSGTPINRAISVANSTLYALSEAVVLATGYTPAIGFIHNGSERSFALDIADTIKVNTTVELAFKLVAESSKDLEMRARHACRDMFKEQSVAKRLVTIIDEVLA